MRHSATLLTALVLTLALPGLGEAPADSPDAKTKTAAPAQQPPVQTLQVFSRETIVDVIVTDARGNPVRNLPQSDFTILEDNKAQPIRGFGEFGVGDLPAHRLPVLPSGMRRT